MCCICVDVPRSCRVIYDVAGQRLCDSCRLYFTLCSYFFLLKQSRSMWWIFFPFFFWIFSLNIISYILMGSHAHRPMIVVAGTHKLHLYYSQYIWHHQIYIYMLNMLNMFDCVDCVYIRMATKCLNSLQAHTNINKKCGS